MTTLRFAEKKDVPQLLPLLEQLGYPTTEHNLMAQLERFTPTNGGGVVVACQEEKPVGWIAWSTSPEFVSHATSFRIEGLIVDKLYRGQGVGKKLMGFLEKWASQYTPSYIELTTGVRRAQEGTHNFYHALGYKNEGPMAQVYLRKEIQ